VFDYDLIPNARFPFRASERIKGIIKGDNGEIRFVCSNTTDALKQRAAAAAGGITLHPAEREICGAAHLWCSLHSRARRE